MGYSRASEDRLAAIDAGVAEQREVPESAMRMATNCGKAYGQDLVETMGLEPTTPALQRQCSSQLSYVPVGRPTRPAYRR